MLIVRHKTLANNPQSVGGMNGWNEDHHVEGSGSVGPAGPQGPQGEIGATGSQGERGDNGATGPQGIQGVKGDTGNTGAAGPQGDTGATGSQGPQGNAGTQGIQGIQGPAGVDGARTATTAFGYSIGAGGTVTQLTNKSTGVTLNKLCGQITTNNAALAAAAEVSFVVTNSLIAGTDVVVACHATGGTGTAYVIKPHTIAAGSFRIMVGNMSAGSLSEALVISFVIIKSVSA